MKESQSKSYLKIAVDSDSDYSEDEKNMSKRPSFA